MRSGKNSRRLTSRRKDESITAVWFARLWSGICAASFAMGAVSGIATAEEFGSDRSGFHGDAGNVIGPLVG